MKRSISLHLGVGVFISNQVNRAWNIALLSKSAALRPFNVKVTRVKTESMRISGSGSRRARRGSRGTPGSSRE